MSAIDLSNASEQETVEILEAAYNRLCDLDALQQFERVRISAQHRIQIAEMATRQETERLQVEEARKIAAEAAEQVRLKAEQNERQAQAEKTRKLMLLRKKCAMAFVAAGVERGDVKIWDRDGERRIYCNLTQTNAIVFYAQGGTKSPGTIVGTPDGADAAALKAAFEITSKSWHSVIFKISESAQYEAQG